LNSARNSVVIPALHSKSWQEKLKQREQHKAMKALEQQLRERKEQKRLQQLERIKQRQKQREENAFKSSTYQEVISCSLDTIYLQFQFRIHLKNNSFLCSSTENTILLLTTDQKYC
jgi:fatty acid-binding protein DegV